MRDTSCTYLPECIYQLVWESQLHHKIVISLFTITNSIMMLKVLWGSWLSRTNRWMHHVRWTRDDPVKANRCARDNSLSAHLFESSQLSFGVFSRKARFFFILFVAGHFSTWDHAPAKPHSMRHSGSITGTGEPCSCETAHPIEPPQGLMHSPTVGPWGGAAYFERGIRVQTNREKWKMLLSRELSAW